MTTQPIPSRPDVVRGEPPNEPSGRTPGFWGRLPGDERGQVTLLAAMMSFLIAVFVALGVYTNIALHRRIVVQNAVDSAAEAAALWQARGCNVVQGLNNLHYTVNAVAGVAESAAAAACVLALLPPFKPACALCVTAPLIDGGQQALNVAITTTQQLVVEATPYLTFLAANACAQGSGADPVTAAVPGAVAEWLKSVDGGMAASFDAHLGLGVLGDLFGKLQHSPVLGKIPVYAVPLELSSLDLHVRRRQGTRFPWTYPGSVGRAADKAGGAACGIAYALSRQLAVNLGWNREWGWQDSYYFGHSGVT